MKTVRTKPLWLLIPAALILVILFYARPYLGSHIQTESDGKVHLLSITNNLPRVLPPIDRPISDTVASPVHWKFLKDSLAYVRDLTNGDLTFYKPGLSFAGLDTYMSGWCDHCEILALPGDHDAFLLKHPSENTIQFSIRLLDWTIDEFPKWQTGDTVVFYRKKGQGYLRTTCNNSKQLYRVNAKLVTNMHIIDRAVPFGYNAAANCITIPTDQRIWYFLAYLLRGLSILSIGFAVILMFNFILFCIDVLRGNTFVPRNFKRLKLIAISLIVYPLCMLVIDLAMPIIFSRYYTAGIVFKAASSIKWLIILAAGLLFYVFYRVFSAGQNLKREHDLVI